MSPTETPRAVEKPCPPCRGLGGFSHGAPNAEAFDRCDRCAGRGTVTERYCTARTLTGECGERVMVRFDEASETWGCIAGHRYTVRRVAGAWAWSRAEDVAAPEAVQA